MTSNARELAQIPSTPSGRRNLIINGAKQIFQRSTSASAVTTDIYAAPDRWKTRVTDTSEFTISQSSTTPDGFANSTKWDCTTANGSLGAAASIIYEQRIEGQDLQHLKYGASSAKTTTLSFYVRSNKTGVYTVGLYSPDGSRHIESSYTINSADTFEKKTITFAGDTGGTLNDDSGEGMRVWFWLGGGTNFSSGTHATSWAAYDATNVLADNQVNLADSTSNEWYITGVQLEVGSVATEFEHRSFGEELALCQRYYQSMSAAVGRSASSTGTPFGSVDLRPYMRAQPSASRLGNSVSSNEAGSTITPSFSGNVQRVFYFNDTNTAAGGLFNLDAEL
tara:strand:+ start:147 stop:1157 length:1011 start_codon:yes stop_codon:yes gene_type:complete